MDQAWAATVHAAFPAHYARVVHAVQSHPAPAQLAALFAELAQRASPTAQQQHVEAPSNAKKRKLDDSTGAVAVAPPSNNGTAPAAVVSSPVVAFECKDVSFQAPARKKLKLQFVADAHDQNRREIRLLHPQSSEVENALPAASIEQAFCLPVPEKQQRQWNFVLFPHAGATAADGTPCEQVVFTMSETAAAGAWAADVQIGEGDTYVTVTRMEMDKLLRQYGKRVTFPDEAEFASSIPQAHRKGEKAYHVKAHRGSKEGYLFFLTNGIVFGFKKPLAFFPFPAIESISYTSVLQRTFNLVVAAREGEDSDVKEVEFSMLDQADFAGIDEYIKRHGLNDASMAAERSAKAYNVNKEKKGDVNGNAVEGGEGEEDGQTELQKAEQMLQDEEDEEEEDYEASGGESDGEGEDSEDEEEEYGDAGDEEGAEEVEHEEDVEE